MQITFSGPVFGTDVAFTAFDGRTEEELEFGEDGNVFGSSVLVFLSVFEGAAEPPPHNVVSYDGSDLAFIDSQGLPVLPFTDFPVFVI